jgi:3-hydroxy-3-methylglutaryl CoA synthase/uncharacterized OB-fold protein
MSERSHKAPQETRRGILSIGAYVPRLRLDRRAVADAHRWMAPGLKALAQGARAIAHWDEDAVTMAVEAGRAALGKGRPAKVDTLVLASTSLPFADRLNAAIVGAALGLDAAVGAHDTGGSLRAGSTALMAALQAGAGNALIVASDRRIPPPASTAELRFGDGAAALLVGEGRPIAVLLGAASTTADFVDHFRESDRHGDYRWEERWIRDEGLAKIVPPTVRRALDAAGIEAGEVDHFVMPDTLPRSAALLAKKLGIRPEAVRSALHEECGDTGTAHPLLMLARVLAQAGPGERIVVAQFSSGCDVLVLETRPEIASRPPEPDWLGGGRAESQYLKYLSFTGQLQPDWGMRAEMDNKTALSAAWRAAAMTNRFEGGRCGQCGTTQFPAGRICVNPACGATDTQTPHRFADEPVRIRSYTCDWLSYRPCPPFMFGHVEFESRARVLMEFVDCDPGELAVGLPLETVFRIKDFDAARGYRRYFWKVRPQHKAGE